MTPHDAHEHLARCAIEREGRGMRTCERCGLKYWPGLLETDLCDFCRGKGELAKPSRTEPETGGLTAFRFYALVSTGVALLVLTMSIWAFLARDNGDTELPKNELPAGLEQRLE